MNQASLSSIVVRGRTRKDLGDVAALAKSINSVGLLHPLVVNSEMQLVAGERRLAAVRTLGWATVPVIVSDRLDEVVKATEAERDENTCRKDFTPSEAVAMGARLESLERPKAEQRRAEHGNTAPGRKNTCGKLPQVKTRDIVGAAVGLSGKSYEKAKAVVEAAKADPVKFNPVLEKMDRDGKVDGAFRQVTRIKAVQKVAHAPGDKYRVLYADPPWKYGDTRNGLDGTTGAEAHYPTLSIEELCALPVLEWAEENAILFLWVTAPLLFECAPVIKAWGFKYKASFVWDKIKHNMGHYNSVRHEFLLVCTRGSCTPDNVKLFDSVQSIERTDHSRKPEEFRQIIETLYPHGKRIELFARIEAKGWERWGNHA